MENESKCYACNRKRDKSKPSIKINDELRDYVQALFYEYNAILLCIVNCISLDVDSTIYEEELKKAYIEFAEAKNCLNKVVLDRFPKAVSWNLNFEEGEIEVNGI